MESKYEGNYKLQIYVTEHESLDLSKHNKQDIKIDMAEYIGKHYVIQLPTDLKPP